MDGVGVGARAAEQAQHQPGDEEHHQRSSQAGPGNRTLEHRDFGKVLQVITALERTGTAL